MTGLGGMGLLATGSLETQSPYDGSAHAIPGRIEAEHYDEGGESVAYHDTGSSNEGGAFRTDEGVDIEATEDSSGSYNVGWTEDGEWLEYTADVAEGLYDVDLRVASDTVGGTLTVSLDGTVLGSVDVSDTGGWQSWTTLSIAAVALDSGTGRTLRLDFTGDSDGLFNLNWIEFSGTEDTTAPTAPTNLSSPGHTDTTVDLTWDAASDDVGVDHYEVYVDGAVDASVTTTSATVDALDAGTTYDFHVTAVDAAGNESDASDTVSQTTDGGQTAYGGTPRPIPGRIQAEHYDEGGEGVSYHDTGSSNEGGAFRTGEGVDIEATDDDSGSYNVGWTADGEWLEYTTDVTAGTYDVNLRVASDGGGGTIDVSLDGTALGSATVSDTGGWQNWTTVTIPEVTVDGGADRTLRLEFSSSDGTLYNVNWVEFAEAGDTTAPTAPTNLSSPAQTETTVDLTWDAASDDVGVDHYEVYVDGAVDASVTTTSATVDGLDTDTTYDFYVTAVDAAGNESDPSNEVFVTTDGTGQQAYGGTRGAIPGRIEAEHYDEGGEGVSYHDTGDSNEGGAFRTGEGVDVEATEDSSGSYNVGWTEDGEWLEYTTDVTAGTYDVNLRVASDGGGGTIDVSLDGTALGSATVSDTGGWQNWTTVTIPDVSVDGGSGRVLRLEFSSSDGTLYNVNWVEFVETDGGDDTTSTTSSDFTAVADGNWADPATWESGTVPTDGSDVHVQSGVTVTLAQQGTARIRHLVVSGTLRHDPTQDTLLRAETVETRDGSRYEMGTESTPVQQGVTAELEFLDEGPIDESKWPERRNKGLIGTGDVEIVGAAKTTWTTLSTAAQAGDTAIDLATEPTNWSAGDTVVLPGMTPYTSESLDHEDETRTVASVSGRTVTFDAALEYDHVPPRSDLDSYALNLSRNARFFSESSDPSRYGHFMIGAPGATVKYLETVQVGRTDKGRDVTAPLWGRGTADPATPPNRRARYAIHSHKTGPTETPHEVVGCSVRDNPGWGIVNHGSNMVVTDNVTYDVKGAGIVAEKGNEAGAFRRNFALRSTGSGEQAGSRKGWKNQHPNEMAEGPHNIDDFGHHGVGFWIHSPIVEVSDNVAAGHRAHGYFFHFRSLYEQELGDGETLDGKHDMVPDLPRSLLTTAEQAFGKAGDGDPIVGDSWHEKDPDVFFSQTCRLRTFSDNEVFGSGAGVSFRSVNFRNHQPRQLWSQPSGFTAYNIGHHILADGSYQGQFVDFESSGNVGLDHRYAGNLEHRNHRLIGNGEGVGVNMNTTYTNTWDVVDCEVRNWHYGYRPKWYRSSGYNEVRGTTFADNDTDIKVASRFAEGPSGLVLSGNTYRSTNRLEWEEIAPWHMHTARVLPDSTRIEWEGRNLYHGWSRPDFVMVEEGDTDRLDEIMKSWEGEWTEALGGDDPRTVLPGATHQELYDQYGITLYGGIQDPTQSGFDQPDDFQQPNDHGYGRDPFLGPADKTMPTDEIWVDATEMSLYGDAYVTTDASETPYLTADQLQSAEHDDCIVLPRFTDDSGATYDFEVSESSDYRVLFRIHFEDNVGTKDYEVKFRFDGGDWINWNQFATSTEATFGWDTEHTVPLSAGAHTIECRSSGGEQHIDKLLIVDERVSASPLGDGKPHTPK